MSLAWSVTDYNRDCRLLLCAEELLEAFDNINPVEALAASVHLLFALQSVVEVEAVHIECHPLLVHSRFRSGLNHTGKYGDALFLQK